MVDNSSQWRMHEDVPLVVSEVNPEALERPPAASSPTPTARRCRRSWRSGRSCDAAGIERVVMSSYQAVSGTGQKAVDELHEQAEAVIEAQELPAAGGLPAPDRLQRAAPGRDLQGRRRLHDRGAQVHARDAQDPRPRRRRRVRHLRARAGLHRATRCRPTCRRASRSRRRSAASCSPRAPGVTVIDDPANGALPDRARRRRPRRRARRPHPPRPLARALPQPLDRRRQPAQGRGDERRPGGRAAAVRGLLRAARA